MNAAIAEADKRIEAQAAVSAERISAIRAEAGQKAAEVAEEAAAALVDKFSPGQGADAGKVRAAVQGALQSRAGA